MRWAWPDGSGVGTGERGGHRDGGDGRRGATQEGWHCSPQPTRRPRSTGPDRWRDQLPPSQALEHFARTRQLPAPEFNAEGTAVTFGDQTFLLGHFGGWRGQLGGRQREPDAVPWV